MLTRRGFAGCAICAVAGFIATDASALDTQPPATPGLTGKMLSRMDGPVPGYVTMIAEMELEPGIMVARHTHPGLESGYVIEGGYELLVEGQLTLSMKPCNHYQVSAGTSQAGRRGDQKTKIVITYVVEKDKPLASPA